MRLSWLGALNRLGSAMDSLHGTDPAGATAGKRTSLSHERGTDPQALARAIEWLVDDDDWFLRDVDKGLAEVERQPLSHDKVGARVEKRIAGISRLADAASLDPTEGADRNGIIAA